MTHDNAHQTFHDVVWEYFQAYGRHNLPWRLSEKGGNFDPYKIMVSELMLFHILYDKSQDDPEITTAGEALRHPFARYTYRVRFSAQHFSLF